MAAQKIHSTTQKFTEIVDFIEDIVVMEGGNCCMIIEITASNFALLSRREQDTRIFSYAAMLNSLSFPIQIIIRNKRMDITIYLKELEEIIKSTKGQQLATYITYYRDFVQEMVTVNVVLNKAFYIVIPYSPLEAGTTATVQNAAQKKTAASPAEEYATNAKKILQPKADSVLGQLQKFATTARVLEREDLIKLFFNIYNQSSNLEAGQLGEAIEAAVITGGAQ